MSGKDLSEIISKMEIDAVNVLKFMASNGLVANPKKTTLLFLNQGKIVEQELSIKIGKKNNIKGVKCKKQLGYKWLPKIY